MVVLVGMAVVVLVGLVGMVVREGTVACMVFAATAKVACMVFAATVKGAPVLKR